MNILHMVADGYSEFNSSNYRTSVPATATQLSGKAQVRIMGIKHWLQQTDYAKRACAWADVIVLQRVLISESITHAQLWTSRGKAVVIDFDDAYDMIRDDNAAYNFWHKGMIEILLSDGHKYEKAMDSHPIEQFTSGLKYVTAVTTPSKRLSKDWEAHAPAFYIPNYLDLLRYSYAKKHHNENLIFGWGGSLSHVPSFTGSGVTDALAQLFSERGNLQFLLVGDKRIAEHLSIPDNQLLFTPYVKFNDWPATLLRYDIGLAPLFGAYDCRRSHLKVSEYVAMKIPFVATYSTTYKEFLGASSGIYVDQGDMESCDQANAEGWYAAFVAMVDNYQAYMDRTEQNKNDYAGTYDSAQNVDSILAVYEEILTLVAK